VWPEVYWPLDRFHPGYATLVARVRGDSRVYLTVVRDAVREVDPKIPVYDVRTLDQRLSDNLARPRFYATAISFFGGFALLLAVVGIYGVAAHSIAQRTHEIGVRAALGASPATLRGMLIRESLVPILAGMGTGVAGAAASGRLLQHLLTGAEPVGIWTCAAAATLLAATSALALWIASARLLRVDPVSALRVD
jgi:ABC-type antimicrobial peptide transport system permease subunit